MRVDNVALLPGYLAAGTAILALIVDLVLPGRAAAVQAATALGAAGTGLAAVLIGLGPARRTFCTAAGCSYQAGPSAAVVAVLFAVLTVAVLGLSGPALRAGAPAGEYCFLLASAMTGGVVVGAAGDLITLVVGLETLTLPLYVLVGLRRRELASAEGAVTFLVVSVVSTAITLLGSALLYASTGAVHFSRLAAVLSDERVRSFPLVPVAVVLVLVGLSFKVAAVPLHAWAPSAYDGAPVPVAAFLSTASKLGGVVALWYVSVRAFGPVLDIAGAVLALLAVATMTVGNLAALRQRRMVRLLAWSSIAQAGYIIAPLGAFAVSGGRETAAVVTAVAATVAYTIFYVVLEIGAFASVVALRGGADGGEIEEYRGVVRRAPWVAVAFTLALVGLAGLPPGLAGLFAKVVVVRSLLAGASGWLAVVVALNAVVGLAYYLRVVALMVAAPTDGGIPEPSTPAAPAPAGGESVVRAPAGGAATATAVAVAESRPAEPARIGWPVAATLALATAAALVIGLFPQLVLRVADLVAR
jgi:NADH-quinone oxidoreductase subunit N